jgi:Ni/Fe-hydrogenase subunit HybB-like protein
MFSTIAGVNIVCAIISAKWAMELEYSQVRQLLFLVGGLIMGPIMLLILYSYLLNKKLKEKKAGTSATG